MTWYPSFPARTMAIACPVWLSTAVACQFGKPLSLCNFHKAALGKSDGQLLKPGDYTQNFRKVRKKSPGGDPGIQMG